LREDLISYDDVGGLSRQIDSLHILIEPQLAQPTLCKALGIRIPRGIFRPDLKDAGSLFLEKPSLVLFRESSGSAFLTRSSEEADRTISNAFAVLLIEERELENHGSDTQDKLEQLWHKHWQTVAAASAVVADGGVSPTNGEVHGRRDSEARDR
jgi:hypothetical protein